jgi:hypothetical protein
MPEVTEGYGLKGKKKSAACGFSNKRILQFAREDRVDLKKSRMEQLAGKP